MDWYNEYDGREAAYLSLANYLINDFNARDSAYIASYIATEPTTKGTPSNIPFKAWLAEAAEDSIGKLGEEGKSYDLLLKVWGILCLSLIDSSTSSLLLRIRVPMC